LVGFVGLALLVGLADAALTSGAVKGWYLSLARPPGTPPGWIFGVVWSVLYVMIGAAAWLVWQRTGAGPTLRLWGWQLGVNAAWAPVFFGLHSPLLALPLVLGLLVLSGVTIRRFWSIDRGAARLMIPYWLWTLYAFYLNAGFCYLNPG
jgi:translocator protein